MEVRREVKIFFLENAKGEGHFDNVNIRTKLTEKGCEGAMDSGDSELDAIVMPWRKVRKTGLT
jgi:hypothetical protein